MDFFDDPHNLPSMIALCICGAIMLVEIVGMLFGFSSFGDHDAHVELNTQGADASDFDVDDALGFIGFGKIPLMAFIAVLCGVFAIVGLVINQLTQSIGGFLIPTFLTIPLTVVITLPIVGRIATKLNRWIPQDESNAINVRDLLGREATVIAGNATADKSASAICSDLYGTIHSFSVRSVDANVTLMEKSKVRLESLSDQGYFYASPIV